SRISPEAPVPVLEVRAHDYRLGGAANAAANIQALGGASTLVGVVGRGETAAAVGGGLPAHRVRGAAVRGPGRPTRAKKRARATSKKTRLVAQQQQIVRVDHEKRRPVDGAIADGIRRAIDGAIRQVQACVLSDYAKGVVTPELAQHAIAAARSAGVPIVVDPKQ